MLIADFSDLFREMYVWSVAIGAGLNVALKSISFDDVTISLASCSLKSHICTDERSSDTFSCFVSQSLQIGNIL